MYSLIRYYACNDGTLEILDADLTNADTKPHRIMIAHSSVFFANCTKC